MYKGAESREDIIEKFEQREGNLNSIDEDGLLIQEEQEKSKNAVE